MNTFAARLKFARQTRRMSQRELAQKSGLSQSAISGYENGTRQATTKISKIAQALNVNVFWLGDGDGQMETGPQTGTLSESGWPFAHIDARQYWSLDMQQRALVEELLGTLIRHFLDMRA